MDFIFGGEMKDRCDIVQVQPVVLAVTQAFVQPAEIPDRIIAMFDLVYQWLAGAPVDQTGPNYAVYDRFKNNGMRMRVGFPVSETFAGDERIQCLELAGGQAAHMLYRGPYNGLPQAHARLNQWCEAQSLQRAGSAWEVYGDWQEDQAKLLTDIYIRLG